MSEIITPKKAATLRQEKTTAVNLELSTEEVSAIIKKLVDEKMVIPNVKGGANPVAINENGCCVDVSGSVLGPVSTIGVSRPTNSTLKETLTKKNINVVLPKNLTIK